MVEYIELADRVVRVKMVPDTPGVCRRRVTLRVVSGPEFSEDEADRVMAAIVAELVGTGNDMIRWWASR